MFDHIDHTNMIHQKYAANFEAYFWLSWLSLSYEGDQGPAIGPFIFQTAENTISWDSQKNPDQYR